MPSDFTATPYGLRTITVSTSVLFVVSMIETVLLSRLVTYTREPSGFTATPSGAVPTSTVAITVLLNVSRTETVSSPLFATYTRVPSRLTANPNGEDPTSTVVTIVLLVMSTTVTTPLLNSVI